MIKDYMSWVIGTIEMNKPDVAHHLIENEHSGNRKAYMSQLAMGHDSEYQFFLKRLIEKYGADHPAVSYIARMFARYDEPVHTTSLDHQIYPLDLIIGMGIKGKTLTEATIKTFKQLGEQYQYALHRGLIDFLYPTQQPKNIQKRTIENFYDHYISFRRLLQDSPDLVKYLEGFNVSFYDEFEETLPINLFAERFEKQSEGYGAIKALHGTSKFARAQSKSNSSNDTSDTEDILLGRDRIMQPSLRTRLIEFRARQRFELATQDHNVDLSDARRHQIFTGPPGTGKTTVANDMGLFFKELGILRSGHVHQTSGTKLIDEYLGNTAPNVRKAFEMAAGGVLFIDEVYHLAMDKHYGPDAINEILAQMEDNRDDTIVIVAGYEEEVEKFLDTNDGLRSRFGGTLEFESFSQDELQQILLLNLRKKGLSMDLDAQSLFIDKLMEMKKIEGKKFGNARTLEVFLNNVITAHAVTWDQRNHGAKLSMLFAPVGEMDLTLSKDDVLSANPAVKLKKKLPERRGIGFGIPLRPED